MPRFSSLGSAAANDVARHNAVNVHTSSPSTDSGTATEAAATLTNEEDVDVQGSGGMVTVVDEMHTLTHYPPPEIVAAEPCDHYSTSGSSSPIEMMRLKLTSMSHYGSENMVTMMMILVVMTKVSRQAVYIECIFVCMYVCEWRAHCCTLVFIHSTGVQKKHLFILLLFTHRLCCLWS